MTGELLITVILGFIVFYLLLTKIENKLNHEQVSKTIYKIQNMTYALSVFIFIAGFIIIMTHFIDWSQY